MGRNLRFSGGVEHRGNGAMDREATSRALRNPPTAGTSRDVSIERCRREITEIEVELLAGNPDVPGLVLALSDWNAELRILEEEKRRRVKTQRRGRDDGCGN